MLENNEHQHMRHQEYSIGEFIQRRDAENREYGEKKQQLGLGLTQIKNLIFLF